jgi:hypothetical protein
MIPGALDGRSAVQRQQMMKQNVVVVVVGMGRVVVVVGGLVVVVGGGLVVVVGAGALVVVVVLDGFLAVVVVVAAWGAVVVVPDDADVLDVVVLEALDDVVLLDRGAPVVVVLLDKWLWGWWVASGGRLVLPPGCSRKAATKNTTRQATTPIRAVRRLPLTAAPSGWSKTNSSWTGSGAWPARAGPDPASDRVPSSSIGARCPSGGRPGQTPGPHRLLGPNSTARRNLDRSSHLAGAQ